MENSEFFPVNSFGFRKGLCTQDYILKLIEIFSKNNEKGLNTVAIIMDLEKAFDNVTDKLLNIMESFGIEFNFIDWIQEFLTNRKYIVTSDNFSSEFITSDGLPQGSGLSPLLFNIYTTGLHDLPSDATLLQFSDDITLIVSGNRNENLKLKCDRIIEIFNNKLLDLNMKVNLMKCSVEIYKI